MGWFADPPWGRLAGFGPMPVGCPDEKTMYVSDTGTVAGGHPNPKLPACSLPPGIAAYHQGPNGKLVQKWRTPTYCDGMRVDVDGYIYTTASRGVKVLTPDGKPLGTIP